MRLDLVKPWVSRRVTQLLGGFEDDVLIGFIHGLLEGEKASQGVGGSGRSERVEVPRV